MVQEQQIKSRHLGPMRKMNTIIIKISNIKDLSDSQNRRSEAVDERFPERLSSIP